jgi:hypothetical protein
VAKRTNHVPARQQYPLVASLVRMVVGDSTAWLIDVYLAVVVHRQEGKSLRFESQRPPGTRGPCLSHALAIGP